VAFQAEASACVRGVLLAQIAFSAIGNAVSPATAWLFPVPHLTRLWPWQVRDTWTVAGRLGDVPGSFIAAALLPALIITVLFYFDHNVSSQMAQQPEFNLVKGSAYHWDFLLLSALVRAKQGAGSSCWLACMQALQTTGSLQTVAADQAG